MLMYEYFETFFIRGGVGYRLICELLVVCYGIFSTGLKACCIVIFWGERVVCGVWRTESRSVV